MGCLDSNSMNYKRRIYNIPIKIKNSGYKKDEIDVYEYESENEFGSFLLNGPYFVCPLCNQRFSQSEMKEIEKIRFHDYYSTLFKYIDTINRNEIDIFEKLEKLAKQIEKEKSFINNPFYKHKCIPNNTEYYIKLYIYPYSDLNLYLKKKDLDERYHYDIWRKDPKIKNSLLWARRQRLRFDFDKFLEAANKRRVEEKEEDDNNKITSGGYFKGKKLCGKVKVVENFPDFKVQVVDHFPDLKVQKVEHFPDDIGKWQFVEDFPDFTIEYVEHFPDFTIQFVDHFPGLP